VNPLNAFTFNRVVFTSSLVLLFLSLLKISAEFIGNSYDWDIDHMMYFGGRFLEGELVWTREFDDKLPLVQILFSLPALFESVRVWQLMSLGLTVLAAGSLWSYLKVIAARDWGLSAEESKGLSLLAASIFLYLLLMLPGSLTHINPAATSLLTISLTLRLRPRFDNSISRSLLEGRYLLAAFCASAAISIRPYFLLPILLIEIWLLFRTQERLINKAGLSTKKLNGILRDALPKLAAWATVIFFFGVVLNAGVYVASGNTAAFFAGLELLSQKLNPQELQSILKSQLGGVRISLSPVLVLAWLSIVIVFIYGLVRQTKDYSNNRIFYIDVFFGAILSPIALELTIASKHYWAHYQQFFVPYAAIAFALFLAWILRSDYLRFSKSSKLAIIFLCLVSGVIILKDSASIAKSVYRSAASLHPLHESLVSLKSFRESTASRDPGFLHPSHMFLHWKLKEPRHGFPHAANTHHILKQEWWEKVIVPQDLPVPTDERSYCEKLMLTGPRFVVDHEESPVIGCLRAEKTRYREIQKLAGAGRSALVVFERE
jgi:hypothetical protein